MSAYTYSMLGRRPWLQAPFQPSKHAKSQLAAGHADRESLARCCSLLSWIAEQKNATDKRRRKLPTSSGKLTPVLDNSHECVVLIPICTHGVPALSSLDKGFWLMW